MKFLKSKRAQLGPIEAKFFFYGFFAAIIVTIALIFLINKGIIPLPFKLTFLCPVCP